MAIKLTKIWFSAHTAEHHETDPPKSPAPTPDQPYRKRRDEKSEKNEKQEKQEKGERQEKGETGFIGYLIGGLILITLGLFSVLQLSGYFTMDSGQSWALMLLIIGVIIIFGAIYVAMGARKRSPQPP